MSSEWSEKQLDEITDVKSGKRLPKGEDLVDYRTIHPYLRLVDVSSGKVRSDGLKYLTTDIHQKIARYIVNADDVCLAIVGHTIGMVFQIDAEYNGANLTENAARLTNFRNVDSRFVFHWLSSPMGQAEIKSRTVGSAQGKLPLYNIRSLPISLPPLPEQRAIAHILGSLDDKIELNRQMNATLEGMAQALFKSWFVDFDPVIDNALAAGNPIPEELADRAEVRRAALADGTANREPAKPFPAAFQHTEELGWIPEGWETTTFGEHICFQTGPAFKSKEFSVSGTRLARGDNVKEGRFHWGEKTRYWPVLDETLEKYLLDSGDVLLGMDGSKVGKNRTRVRETDLPCLLVQRVARISKKNTICNGFIFLVVNSPQFRDYVEVVKTGSAIPHISGGQIKGLPLPLPSNESSPIFEFFENIVTPIFSRTDALLADSIILTKLRDTLLPKLISGELRIPDAGKLAEEALA